MSKGQLNILQRGHFLQFVVYGIVSVFSIFFIGFITNLSTKGSLIAIFNNHQSKGLINLDVLQAATKVIKSVSWIQSSFALGIALIGGVVCWYALRWAVNWNLSSPKTLPKAVEFRFAMRKLGVDDPADWIHYIFKHHLPVYITVLPLAAEEQENVRARFFSRVPNRHLVSQKVLEQNAGRQTLCLDTDDFQRLLDQHYPKTTSDYLNLIAEMEKNITALSTLNSSQSSNISKLEEKVKDLHEKNNDKRKKENTDKARKIKEYKTYVARIPFYIVADSLIYKIKLNSGPGIKYTRPDIQLCFEKELENHQELKPEIEQLLRTNNKIEEKTPFPLDGWPMDYIRYGLGNLVQTEPGAPPKTK